MTADSKGELIRKSSKESKLYEIVMVQFQVLLSDCSHPGKLTGANNMTRHDMTDHDSSGPSELAYHLIFKLMLLAPLDTEPA